MKPLGFLTILIAFNCTFFSCTNEGCQDVEALNYDSSANTSGPCTYTRVIFYAGRNRIGGFGVTVDKIEVFKRTTNGDELVGTLENLEDTNDAPSGCTPSEKSFVYEFTSPTKFGDNPNVPQLFVTRYYFADQTQDTGDSYEFSTDPNTECIVQNLTL